MKGNRNTRYRLKTKMVHGVRTGEHNNPHVMKAARRAHGGVCEGEAAPRNLARSGRMKTSRKGKNDGGGLNWAGAGRALSNLAGLGMGSDGAGRAAQPQQPDDLTATQRAGQAMMNLSAAGMRKRGGSVKAHGGAVSDTDERVRQGTRGAAAGSAGSAAGPALTRGAMRTAAPPSPPIEPVVLEPDLGSVVPMAVRNDRLLDLAPPSEAAPFKDGGVASSRLSDEALDLHALEHKLLAARAKGRADGGRANDDDEEEEDSDDDERKNGGPLTAKQRNALPRESFALSGRRYPINDPSHARNALARVSQHGTPEEKSKVRAAVHKKYPGIGKDD